MRSGHLSRDVVSDDRLSEVLQVLSHLGYVMTLNWYRAYTPVHTVWDTQGSLTCVFTLWAAGKEKHLLWKLEPLWSQDGDLAIRYRTRSPGRSHRRTVTVVSSPSFKVGRWSADMISPSHTGGRDAIRRDKTVPSGSVRGCRTVFHSSSGPS